MFVHNTQVIGCVGRLRNDLYCVGWGVKLYSTNTATCVCLFGHILCSDLFCFCVAGNIGELLHLVLVVLTRWS